MNSIVHYRHAVAMDKAEKFLRTLPEGIEYILVLHDNAQVPRLDRQASFTSSSNIEDMKAILNEVARRA